MSHARACTGIISTICLLTAAAATTPAATAKVVDSGTEFLEFSFTFESLCDVAGLDVDIEGVFEARWRATPHGRNAIPYYVQNGALRRTLTNPDTGLWVTESVRVLEKDQRITDNGDGTFTILALATGSASVRDSSGKLIAANPGQVRFELLFDDNGTPTDPTDDYFVEFLGVTKGSTGRNDDFCASVVPALT